LLASPYGLKHGKGSSHNSYPYVFAAFTLNMAIALFAKTLDNTQHLTQLNPESQSYTNSQSSS
jgi:hypothetical protein